ncbi:MAG TPA: LysR family transcriptional regulator [Alphaproteobacteria bacterium]|nr:LysR family transcriptional regulator [Alphaproteobacteria bacterium]MDP7164918.1 LysR family transcriptional regulator [Alphaproteobacteria bacterium]MDP7428174.1 LysR family transcriptional regulator [Alphaproteobacteria bacterium]HJM52181.1 LysR family transcriptional regulator [Alphaproteobacteria bacterium]
MARSTKRPEQQPPRRPAGVRVAFGSLYPLGPGKLALIEAIAEAGSISAAARSLGMSYRRAWLLVDATNRSFRQPLVETATGGRGGGGARVTAAGHQALALYRRIEDIAVASVREEVAAFSALLADDIPLLPDDPDDPDR